MDSNNSNDNSNNDNTPNTNGINLDSYFNATDSILNNPTQLPAIDFDANYEVAAKKIRVSSLIGTSSQTVTNAATLPAGAAATFTTQLTPTQRNNIGLRNMALPYVAIYEGTGPVGGVVQGSAQLFPRIGAGELAEKMRFYPGFDWHDWSGSSMTSLYRVTMYNNSGTSIIIFGVSQWAYIQNNGGTST